MLTVYTLILVIIMPLKNNRYYGIYYFKITAVVFLILLYISLNTLNVIDINNIYLALNGAYIINSLTIVIHMLVFIVSIGLCLLIPKYVEKNNIISNHVLVVLLNVIGACSIISSNSLISLYISLEIQSLSLYLISSIYNRTEKGISSGLMYLIVGVLASALILLGIVNIYKSTGNWDFTEYHTMKDIFTMSRSDTSIIDNIGIILLIIGIIVKIGAAPIHIWTPKVYNNTPTIISIWLIILPKISLLSVLINLNLIGENSQITNVILVLITCISLIIGSILGISQVYIKKVLTYSAIINIGNILIPLTVLGPTLDSDGAVLLFLIQYSLTTVGALGVVKICNKNGLDIIYTKELNSLWYRNKGVSIIYIIILLSISGIPPFIGFIGKLGIFTQSLSQEVYLVCIIAVLASVISTYYYLKIIVSVIFKPENVSEITDTFKVSNMEVYSLLIILGIIIIFPIKWDIIISFCSAIISIKYIT